LELTVDPEVADEAVAVVETGITAAVGWATLVEGVTFGFPWPTAANDNSSTKLQIHR
jgi:hypothetical protein